MKEPLLFAAVPIRSGLLQYIAAVHCAQLAEKAGISRPHMGAIEAPNLCRPISLELLFNLADALGVEPYKLLEFRDGR